MHSLDTYLNLPLKPKQYEYVDYARVHHYCIIGAKQGSGKTIVGITISLFEGGKTIIICPAFLRINWKEEYEVFSRDKKSIVVITSGKKAENTKADDADVFIVNYALLGKCEHLFKSVSTVIADEAHYLLNPKAKRTKNMYKYIQKSIPNRLLLMTGTPNKGKGQQWFTLIKLCSINPRHTSGLNVNNYYQSYWDFQHTFCHKTILNIGGREVTQFDGIRNVDKLKKLLKGKYIRGKKVDHGDIELVQKDVLVREVSDKKLLEAWESFDNGERGEHIASAKSASALNKVPLTVEYVKNLIDTGEKPLIVYTDHLASLKSLNEEFKKLGYSVGSVDGSKSMNHRNMVVKSFQAGELDVVTATITSFNTGVTLTKSWNIVVNDQNWDWTQMDQAHHRIFRIGQVRDCIIHNILGSREDKMITKNLKKRKLVIDKVVEDL